MCIPGLRTASYTATVRLTAGRPAERALLPPAARSSPTRIPQSPPLRNRYSIDGRIPSNITSSIELSCFSPVAQNNLLLLTSRSSLISLSEIVSQLCTRHTRSNQCAHTQFTSEQQAGWWCPRQHIHQVSTSKLDQISK